MRGRERGREEGVGEKAREGRRRGREGGGGGKEGEGEKRGREVERGDYIPDRQEI